MSDLNCLQGWLYLEPIFGSEDILQQMPNEGRKFRAVDATWRRVMAAVRKAPEVLVMCSDDELLKNLIEANKFLEQVQSVTSLLHSMSSLLSQLQAHGHCRYIPYLALTLRIVLAGSKRGPSEWCGTALNDLLRDKRLLMILVECLQFTSFATLQMLYSSWV